MLDFFFLQNVRNFFVELFFSLKPSIHTSRPKGLTTLSVTGTYGDTKTKSWMISSVIGTYGDTKTVDLKFDSWHQWGLSPCFSEFPLMVTKHGFSDNAEKKYIRNFIQNSFALLSIQYSWWFDWYWGAKLILFTIASQCTAKVKTLDPHTSQTIRNME